MAKIYKIHPSIGIARAGNSVLPESNSPERFFIGPENSGSASVEIDDTDQEVMVQNFRHNGRLKRQAARFRVFEYEKSPAGTLTLEREMTADQATIEWHVTVANHKGDGWTQPLPRPAFQHSGPPTRNPSVGDRSTLRIEPDPQTISGRKTPAKVFGGSKARFLTKPDIYLGELQTDAAGRLLVIGGKGESASPTGASIVDWFSNNGWYDDMADGPVTARITLPGQAPAVVDAPAWVMVGPPDFAPGIGFLITLYDELANTANLAVPSPVKARADIFPILRRAAAFRWTHSTSWRTIPQDEEGQKALSKPGSSQSDRKKAFDKIVSLHGLDNRIVFPARLLRTLEAWRDGNVVDDWDDSLAAAPMTPEGLDKAALENCVGGLFFPGIEAGWNIANNALYAEPFRLSHEKVKAGDLTRVMALPWQTDFHDCMSEWWPSQRPDRAFLDPETAETSPSVLWAEGADEDPSPVGLTRMAKHWAGLGFIVRRKNSQDRMVFTEQERTLPRRT